MKIEDFTKEEIIDCLAHEIIDSPVICGFDNIVRKLATRRYDKKSRQLLDRMDYTNRKSRAIKIPDKKQDPEGYIKKVHEWLKWHEEWEKANKELDKLSKWIESLL